MTTSAEALAAYEAERQREREEFEKDEAAYNDAVFWIKEITSLYRLNGIEREWEDRMKVLAAERLNPGSDEVITDVNALDYIWSLGGDRVSRSGQPFYARALDYYVGRKVEHVWGTGVIVKTSKKDEYPARYGIKVRLACMNRSCRGTITVYAGPGCHNGAFCYVSDRAGNHLADLRNQCFKCKKCR